MVACTRTVSKRPDRKTNHCTHVHTKDTRTLDATAVSTDVNDTHQNNSPPVTVTSLVAVKADHLKRNLHIQSKQWRAVMSEKNSEVQCSGNTLNRSLCIFSTCVQVSWGSCGPLSTCYNSTFDDNKRLLRKLHGEWQRRGSKKLSKIENTTLTARRICVVCYNHVKRCWLFGGSRQE